MSANDRDLPTLKGLGEQYEIVRELGRGGTAVVYLGRDRDLQRDVAIKVIRSTFVEDEEAMARLVREARTVAGLQHPNIVMLYGTQTLDDGSLALVMQYVPGQSLKELVRSQGPLTYARAGQILQDVGSALSYAHRRRIVHRDIKPENIYLDDDAGVARLSDFGIARPWDSESNLTLPGMALGTPAYMSPEQIDGRKLDGRSDLYSLGLVGYEMLTGQQPWAGENLYTIIYRQKQDHLPPLHELRPDVPAHLQQAIEVALSKAMDARWASADDFIRQVRSGPLPDSPPPVGLRPSAPVAAPVVSEDAQTIMYRRSEEDEESSESSADPFVDAAAVAAGNATQIETGSRRGYGRRSRWLAMATGPLLAVAAVALWAVAQSGASPEPVSAIPGDVSTLTAVADQGADDLGGTMPGVTSERPIDDPDVDGSSVPVPGPQGAGAGTAASIPAALRAFGGDGQVVEPGTMLPDPLIVRVEDAVGSPVPGALVRFAVDRGEGFVGPDSVVTDASGLAVTRWMVGPGEGEQVVIATAPNFAGPAATFRATVASSAPSGSDASLSIVAGGNQTGAPGSALSTPVVLEALDAQGRPVSGLPLAVTVTRGGGSVDATRSVTDDAGRVRISWTLGSESDQRLEVVGLGLEGRPVEVSARTDAPTVAIRPGIVAGGTHSCAVTAAGTPSCWGGNDHGQLGDGERVRRSAPTPLAGPPSLARISAGFTHTCGLAPDGTAYCWGANESGQLGDGTASRSSTPAPVAGGLRFSSIAAGVSHTCALAPGGRAYCWGANMNGQLGDGTRSSRSTPGQVAGSLRFASLVVGWTHTCGLTQGGSTYCWGRNAHGQLGDGSGIDRVGPTEVTDVPSFREISAGSAHTCGVATGGDAYCWGQNTYGQLGDGTAQNRTAPVAVSRIAGVRRIAAGGVHTCALTEDGTAFCWGRNTYGQLGDGTTADQPTPTPVAGSARFTSITASGAHTCGETSSGPMCWGYNVEGQLGDGSRANRPVPTAVERIPR